MLRVSTSGPLAEATALVLILSMELAIDVVGESVLDLAWPRAFSSELPWFFFLFLAARLTCLGSRGWVNYSPSIESGFSSCECLFCS